ncbi:MAG: 3-isopropylmalate dehydrogenase [Ktedonobacterales bacterium]|nr:3-isopropylmalate dehydrogenase [Ktedonobacterales bacterium]
MTHYHLAVLGGDGIGPEVTNEAVRVLQAIGARYGHTFATQTALVGQAAIDQEGTALSDATLALCAQSDAILFGAVGGATAQLTGGAKPEDAILGLRKALELFANLRPVTVMPALIDATAFKPERLHGVDLVVVRELTGGLYFGRPSEIRAEAEGTVAIDTMLYTEAEIERVVRFACTLARQRRRKVTSVDKANVLSCSRLWRQVAERVAQEFPDVALHHMLVDSCAMALIRQPADFDVIVTENMFGDILTDEASMLAGSLGLLPSASLGTRTTAHGRFGLYEPIHGSAPDIAGLGQANPLAAILSAALLLRHSLGLPDEATAIEAAVAATVAEGVRTPDIATPTSTVVTTHAMGDAVLARIADSLPSPR